MLIHKNHANSTCVSQAKPDKKNLFKILIPLDSLVVARCITGSES